MKYTVSRRPCLYSTWAVFFFPFKYTSSLFRRLFNVCRGLRIGLQHQANLICSPAALRKCAVRRKQVVDVSIGHWKWNVWKYPDVHQNCLISQNETAENIVEICSTNQNSMVSSRCSRQSAAKQQHSLPIVLFLFYEKNHILRCYKLMKIASSHIRERPFLMYEKIKWK